MIISFFSTCVDSIWLDVFFLATANSVPLEEEIGQSLGLSAFWFSLVFCCQGKADDTIPFPYKKPTGETLCVYT